MIDLLYCGWYNSINENKTAKVMNMSILQVNGILDGQKVVVKLDSCDNPYSPRGFSNLGKLFLKGTVDENKGEYNTEVLIAFSRGDDIESACDFALKFGNVTSKSELRKEYRKIKSEVGVALPVYRYEHSDIAFSTEPFSCPWDSGLAGVIFATKKDIRSELSVKLVNSNNIKKAVSNLKSEIDSYSKWANGEVYSVSIYSECGEMLDSCGGIYLNDGESLENALIEESISVFGLDRDSFKAS